MKKFLLTAMVILMIAICASGCTKGNSFVNYNEDAGNEFWNASYEKFDGYREKEITLSGDGEHTFSVDVVTNSGKLCLSIKDNDGKSLYNGTDIPSSSFKVTGYGEGKYMIRFDADNHSGSFDITWE